MTVVERRSARRRAEKRRPRLSIVGILGELLITAGVVVLLFLGWQVWLNDLIVGSEQNEQAHQLSESWSRGDGAQMASPDRRDPGDPVVGTAPGNAEKFANLIVPRFGEGWTRSIAEGIGVYDVLSEGIGHYPGTAMPGGIGNSAYAAHRTGWGAPFGDIANLQIGDSIYVETEAGWYRYAVRSLEYVMPSGVGVLDPVPQSPGATATDRLITLTSCNPKLTAAERIIVYGVYDTWYPRADGAPPEIASTVSASAAR